MPDVSENNSNIVLKAHNIVKTFPGVRALDRVGFELRRGEVHALVGENGAGKSTLIHILGGVHQADSGQIYLEGKAVSFSNPHSAAVHGIGVVFQELSVMGNLSVAENIFANRQPVKYAGFPKRPLSRLGALLNMVDRKRLCNETAKILKLFELEIDPRTQLRHLTADEQQVVEILKAISGTPAAKRCGWEGSHFANSRKMGPEPSQNPRVLILDEPTSSLTATHTRLLFKIIKKLKQQGLSIIYISHHLPEIFEVADRVTVLRDGKYVQTCQVRGVSEQDLVRKMVGREIIDMYGRRTREPGRECFRVEGVGRGKDFQDISFSVRCGEIVGIAGLSGAGRTQLARGIFGAEPLETGRMYLNNQSVEIGSPQQAINNRLGFLTEDRKYQGLFLQMTIRENCVAPSLRCFVNKLGLMNEKAITDFAEASRMKLNIVTPSIWQQVANLSGGNQQKVLLSMWMGIQPMLLIVDEPTRGVDVGAKSEIYHLLRELAARGRTYRLHCCPCPTRAS